MTRNLLAIALAGSACWSAGVAPPTTEPPPLAGTATPSTPRGPACVRAGDRLELEVCRMDRDLAWTITNRTDTTLWAFVAPPSVRNGRSRENAIARATDGRVLLTKIQFGAVGDHPTFTGAVALAPGQSDAGVVPIGDRLDPRARNFTGVAVTGTPLVREVALEIGFAEQRRGDRSRPAEPFVILDGFDRSRQEMVRSPELAWR